MFERFRRTPKPTEPVDPPDWFGFSAEIQKKVIDILRFDIVVQGVTWFEFQGSACAVRSLEVLGA